MNTKQTIFDCALALFSQQGYNGVSMRDIARKVGIKGSSIYNHYTGKKAIMDDICQTFVHTLTYSRPPIAEIEDHLDEKSAAEVFQSFILSYGQRIDQKWTQMARLIFSEHFYNDTAGQIFHQELIEKNVAYYVSVLNLLEQKGKIKCRDKQLIAHLFNNEQLMLSMQYAHAQTNDERQKLAELMIRSAGYLIHGMERSN
ncbi:MAG: TetR/AcrR family transcriptional regulator [Sporolactobacillus sp.]